MKSNSLIVLLFLAVTGTANAQSKTTEALAKKHTDALSLFFYNNTLRMLNQANDPGFDELIKDIEKMKFLLIKKDERNFDPDTYKQLIGDYKAEEFEEIMTSRFEGKNLDVFLKEKDGKTKGMLVLVNDKESLYILDILGKINVNKVTDLYSTLDKNSEIGQKIKAFVQDGDDGVKKVEKSERSNRDDKN
jgi:hypothetical protein